MPWGAQTGVDELIRGNVAGCGEGTPGMAWGCAG